MRKTTLPLSTRPWCLHGPNILCLARILLQTSLAFLHPVRKAYICQLESDMSVQSLAHQCDPAHILESGHEYVSRAALATFHGFGQVLCEFDFSYF